MHQHKVRQQSTNLIWAYLSMFSRIQRKYSKILLLSGDEKYKLRYKLIHGRTIVCMYVRIVIVLVIRDNLVFQVFKMFFSLSRIDRDRKIVKEHVLPWHCSRQWCSVVTSLRITAILLHIETPFFKRKKRENKQSSDLCWKKPLCH